MANITLMGASYTDVPAVDLPQTGGGTVRFYESGGGSSAQTATGTVSGSGNNVLQIPCDFAPDLIYVYGDMSDDVSNRGVVSMTIIKDTVVYMSVDTSSSNTDEFAIGIYHGIVGYNGSDSSAPHATLSNGTLSLDTAILNSSSGRWRSGQTYNYKFIKWT